MTSRSVARVRAPRSATGRRLGVAAAAAIGASMLVSCSSDPEPDGAAAELAAGLSTLELGSVPLTGATAPEAQQQLTTALAELNGVRPVVSVENTQLSDDSATATATLAVSWDLDTTGATAFPDPAAAADWSYTTKAALTLGEDDTWTVAWSLTLLEPSLVAGEHLVVQEVVPERADILGADGEVLVTDRPVVRVGIDKTLIGGTQLAASADQLAEVVGIDRAAYAERVATAGEKAFVEAIVLRADGSSPISFAELASIPGVAQIDDEIPLAPTRQFARPILGTVGEATAELIAESDGRLQVGDVTGLSGLQRSQDAQLAGQPGLTMVAVAAAAADGTPGAERQLFRRDSTAGTPLTTTLDLDLQTLAESVLEPVGPPSAIVAIRPSTGDVLAAASGPGSEGYSTATLGQYAPGSTFKVVSALALLRSGATPDTAVACTPTITVDGREFTNYSDYPSSALGDIPLSEAIANSCNTAMIAARDDVPQAALTDAATALGLGPDLDLGVPYFAGSVPTDSEGTEHAASMIGQGRVEASPLAMATVAASVAAGHTVVPRLVVDSAAAVTPAAAGTLEPELAGQLLTMMRGVVIDGSAGFLADLPGDVAAKTGTAEYGSDQPPRTHAWMIAVRGDLAVAVFVEDGESGSRTAGPLLEEFLSGTP